MSNLFKKLLYSESLENTPLIKGDYVTVRYFEGKLTFLVLEIVPAAEAVIVTPKTVFFVGEKDESLHVLPQISCEDIGSLTDEIRKNIYKIFQKNGLDLTTPIVFKAEKDSSTFHSK